jgi:RNA polymerase sigma-70 factor (ECF subfamily)
MLATTSRTRGALETTAPHASQMEAYLRGDDHALAGLFRLLAPRIRRVVQMRIDDPDLVDDIVQLTFVKAHRGRHAFRARLAEDGAAPRDDARRDDAVIAWYLAIARNTAVDGVRSERRHQQRRVRSSATQHAIDVEPYDDVPSGELDPEQLAIDTESRAAERARVRAAIDALPTSQRDVVVLHKLEGLPMQVVAERLHVRPGAARVRAHRAYLALERSLGSAAA